ncbi:MAG: type II secretion system F family protein [Pseudomonadota bacterium]
MPRYIYRAIDKNSHISRGMLVAESSAALEQRVTELGLWLIEAREEQKLKAQTRSAKDTNVARLDLADFFSGLGTLIDAGIDVAGALRVVVAETPDEGFREVLTELRGGIEQGKTFHDVMSAYPAVFSQQICNLIHAGESSGQLVEACFDIAEHLEWTDRLMADVKQATMYPTLLVIAVSGLIFLMFSVVVPEFALIFDELDLALPAITQGVMAVGAFFDQYWWMVLAGVAVLIAALVKGPNLSPSFALWLDRLKLTMPLFGPVNHLLVQSRFAHNLALMLKAGLPIVESVNLVSGTVGNRVMSDALDDCRAALIDGRKMSDALGHSNVVSPIVMRMILVGEETGQLDICLEKASKRFDQEIPRRIKRLFGMLEPAIIVSLLGVVGLVAAAIFMPLFAMMNGLRA